MDFAYLMPRPRRKSKADRSDRFASLQRHSDQQFAELSVSSDAPPDVESTGTLLRPEVDMVVDEDLVRVTAELAGVDKDDLEISLPDSSTLVIQGEKKSEQRKEAFGELHVERHFGSFYRALPLPCEVVPEYVEAKFHRGVLTVDLPRVKDEQPDAPEPPAED